MFIGIYEGHHLLNQELFTVNGKIDNFDKTMAALTDELQANG